MATTKTAQFHVAALFDPAEDVLLYERVGDAQPSFDPDNAIESLAVSDEGYVAVDGEPGETFWLFQQTGEDENGAVIGRQVSVTIADPDSEPLPLGPGDDPQTLIADQQAQADASHEQSLTPIDAREQEALKQEGIAAQEDGDNGEGTEPEPEPSLEMTREELAELAEQRGVNVTSSMTKGDIKDAIEAGPTS